MKYLKRLLFLALFFLQCFSAHGKTLIFILASYHQNDPFENSEYRGVIQALKFGIFQKFEIQSFFLDSRRLDKKTINKKANEALQIIDKKKPKIVIALDDLAFNVCAKKVIAMKQTFLVFAGINQDLDIYNKKFHFLKQNMPIRNITGVYEYLFSREQMEMLDLLLTPPYRVAMLYSTDYMGKIAKSQILNELKGTPYQNRLELFPVKTTKDLKAAIKTIANRSDIKAYFPLTLSVYDPAKNIRLTIKDIAPLLISQIKKIDICLNESTAKSPFCN